MTNIRNSIIYQMLSCWMLSAPYASPASRFCVIYQPEAASEDPPSISYSFHPAQHWARCHLGRRKGLAGECNFHSQYCYQQNGWPTWPCPQYPTITSLGTWRVSDTISGPWHRYAPASFVLRRHKFGIWSMGWAPGTVEPKCRHDRTQLQYPLVGWHGNGTSQSNFS